MPEPLSEKQNLVYEFILDFLLCNYTMPTFEEISEEFNFLSNNSSHGLVKQLIKKGWLKPIKKGSRKSNYKPIHIELTIIRTEDV